MAAENAQTESLLWRVDAAHPADAGEDARDASRLGRGWEGSVLLVVTVVLLSAGLVSVYSASAVLAKSRGLPDYYFAVRQAVAGALGLVALVVCAQLDYRWLRKLAWPILAVVVVSLVALVLPWTHGIAPPVNGARRWLNVAGLSLQPVELAKLAVVIWTAALAVKKQELLSSLSRGLLPFLLVWGGLVGLIILQPDFSSALLVLLLAGLVIFAGGGRLGHLILLLLLAVPLLWNLLGEAEYRLQRIAAFLKPAADPAGMSYQVNQSLISIGSGGLFGRGFGRGQQQFGFLPEPHNDFVFAMIGEQWGFLGLMVLVLGFVAIGMIGYRVASQAPDLFGMLLAIGLTNLIVLQAFLHMGVNLALLPTTGLTLPFVSYGRSSLLVCLAAMGLLIGIARAGCRPEPSVPQPGRPASDLQAGGGRT